MGPEALTLAYEAQQSWQTLSLQYRETDQKGPQDPTVQSLRGPRQPPGPKRPEVWEPRGPEGPYRPESLADLIGSAAYEPQYMRPRGPQYLRASAHYGSQGGQVA